MRNIGPKPWAFILRKQFCNIQKAGIILTSEARYKRPASQKSAKKMEIHLLFFQMLGNNYEKNNLNPLIFQHRLGNNDYENSLSILSLCNLLLG